MLAILLLRCNHDTTPGPQDVEVHEKSRAPICVDHPEISTIDLNGALLTETLELAIPKQVSSLDHRLFAVPYSTNGDEIMDEYLVWKSVDDTLVTFTSHAWNDNTVSVNVMRDLFDGQGHEPVTDARACVKDSCANCTSFRIVGLVDVGGTWRITSAQFPLTFEVDINQHGRELSPSLDLHGGIIASLQGNHVTFVHGSSRYECTLKSRTFCAGHTTDLQTGGTLARWNAVKQ